MSDMTWNIEVTSNGHSMGQPIPATKWDVLSKLAAIKAAIPATWQAEAYPNISAWNTPSLASAPVPGMIYPPIAHSGTGHTYPLAHHVRPARLHVSAMVRDDTAYGNQPM